MKENNTMLSTIQLRDIEREDLDLFFVHQLDNEAIHMAAFTAKDPSDRNHFNRHWQRLMSDPRIIKRSILVDDSLVGHVIAYPGTPDLEITYWLDRSYWGRGIASEALRQFLTIVPTRPLAARVVKDNRASMRVLQKCGFQVVGEDSGFANGRNARVDEYLLTLI